MTAKQHTYISYIYNTLLRHLRHHLAWLPGIRCSAQELLQGILEGLRIVLLRVVSQLQNSQYDTCVTDAMCGTQAVLQRQPLQLRLTLHSSSTAQLGRSSLPHAPLIVALYTAWLYFLYCL